MQEPAIIAAHKLGYKAVVADGNPNACSVRFADTFVPIDLKDREALLAYALSKKDDIKAVFTCGTDFSASVSYVAEKLDLKSHTLEAALNASDKIRMRRCFSENGVPSPSFSEITTDDWTSLCSSCGSAAGAAEKLLKDAGFSSFPLVIKPCDNMGGRGCRMINSAAGLPEAVADALKYSRSGRAILEDYMEGPEFSIDALVFNGEVTITGFADRHIYFPPYFIEMGHTMPTDIPQKDWNALAECFQKGIKALGLTHGVAKADIKLTSRGPMIGEIAARLSGGYMSGWTFPYASYMDLTKQAMLLALGEEPEEIMQKRVKTDIPGVYTVPTYQVSAERAWLSIPGKVKAVTGLKDADCNCVHEIFPRVFEGDSITFPVNNVGKCGNVISAEDTRAKAIAAAEKGISLIIVRLEKDNAETDAFLNAPLDTAYPPSAYQLGESVFAEIEQIASDARFTLSEGAVPAILKPYEDCADWNCRTIRKACDQLFKLCGNRTVNEKAFVRSLVRGGIQGALYIIDGEAR